MGATAFDRPGGDPALPDWRAIPAGGAESDAGDVVQSYLDKYGKKKAPKKGEATVTAGEPISVGTPADEIARLRTSGSLADRIEAALRAAPEVTARPELERAVASDVDRRTPMSLARGAAELATAGAVENVTPTAGDANVDAMLDKMARSGVDVSDPWTANLLAGERVAGNLAGMVATFPEAAIEGLAAAPRAVRLLARGAAAGTQAAAVSAEGSALEGDPLGEALKKAGEQFAGGFALGGMASPEFRDVVHEAVPIDEALSHMAPSASSSGRPLTGSWDVAPSRPGYVGAPTRFQPSDRFKPTDLGPAFDKSTQSPVLRAEEAAGAEPPEPLEQRRPIAGVRPGAVGDLSKVPGATPKPAIEHAGPAEGDEAPGHATVGGALFNRAAAARAYEAETQNSWDDLRPEEQASLEREQAVSRNTGFGASLVSRTAQAINGSPFEKGTAEQWAAQLKKNVPGGEREWTGLDDFLGANAGKTLTRQQVADQFNAGRIQMGETRFGSGDVPAWDDGNRTTAPRYSGYVEPGGTNYRESVITLQPSERQIRVEENPDPQGASDMYIARDAAGREVGRGMTSEDARTAAGGPETYMSSHWPGVENPLLHVRMSDRTLPSGEKALFVEEIQSDWHQQGRRKGYADEQSPAEQASRAAWNKADADYAEAGRRMDELLNRHRATRAPSEGDAAWAAAKQDPDWQAAKSDYDAALARRDAAEADIPSHPESSERVPNAPFKKTPEWAELGMKRAIDEAARGGYDRVVWTTGDQQARRYDLSKQIDELRYFPENSLLVARKDGRIVHSGNYDPKALPDVVGKEAADKLLASPLNQLSGVDLRVGGEGMKAFYDRMLPNVVRDYAKAHGVKLDVEPTDIGAEPTPGDGEWVGRAGGVNDTGDPTLRIAAPDVDNAIEVAREMAEEDRGDAEHGPRSASTLAALEEVAQRMHPNRRTVRSFGTVMADLDPARQQAIADFMEIKPHEGEPGGLNPSFKVTPELRQMVLERGQRLGFASPRVIAAGGGGVIGGAVGAATGDTPEERRRNAVLGIGAGVALGAGFGPKLDAAGPEIRQALTDAYAPIRETEPELHATLHAAGAMPPTSAARFVGGLVDRALTKLTPGQKDLFGRRVLLDNLEAEASRKAAAAGQPGVEPSIADELRRQAVNFTRHAGKVAATIPQGVENAPWFQEALAQAKLQVQPFNAAGAVGAGVETTRFRQPSLGLYMRLMSRDRYNERMIGATQDAAAPANAPTPEAIAAAPATGATTPREPPPKQDVGPVGKAAAKVAKVVAGEKPAVVQLTPAGAERPLQGPADVQREVAARGDLPPGTARSPAAQSATGDASSYLSDFRTSAMTDAADKVAKMQRNAVWKAIDAAAQRPESGIRPLTPEQNAPPGKRGLLFNDVNQLIPPLPPQSPIPEGFRRYAVPLEVGNAIKRWQDATTGGEGPSLARRVAGGVTKIALLNPVAAGIHGLTLASSVGTGIPADAGVANALASGLPAAKVATTINRMRDVDFSSPQTVDRLHRMALSGALRIAPDEGGGWINRGHHILFGPGGIDPRARIVASEDFESQMRAAGMDAKDPAYTAIERDYVNQHAGNYVSQNQGTAQQWLQEAGIAPFLAINRAKLVTAFSSMVGAGGVPGASMPARLQLVARGPAGAAAAIAGAGYLLSGHGPQTNAPGHEGDVATGVYHLPDSTGVYHPTDLSSFRHFRGSPDEAAKALGPDAKEVYLRRGFIDPTSAAALRILEPIATADPGSKVSETLRAAANAAIGMAGPMPSALMGALTGRALYIGRDGEWGNLQGIHLMKDAGLVDRLLAVARSANAGAAMMVPSPTPEGRAGISSLLGNLNPVTEARAGSAPRISAERHNVQQVLDDAASRIAGEKDPVKKAAIINDLSHQFDAGNLAEDPEVTRGLAKLRRTLVRTERPGKAPKPIAAGPSAVDFYLQRYGAKP